MERIVIKPTVKEIVHRGKAEDGHVDVFSYNYEGSAANNLGGLFIVGQVQPATEDTSYMVNLVASLAKREYYSKADEAPKEAFSKTLKKINEVLQDFFRNKELKVNIGIFAVTGENIFISRLGKFKIILGRDNQDIDILNNINLFNKEHIQEKEFSNIISGKIMPKDKIFAFYPGRSITAREKNIKADLLKLDAVNFTEKLNSIRKTNDNFLCAGVHITIDKYTESAIVPPPQPQELRGDPLRHSSSEASSPKATLARTTKTTKEKPVVTVPAVGQELPDIRPRSARGFGEASPLPKVKSAPEQAPSIKLEPTPQPQPEIKAKSEQDLLKSNVYYPGNKSLASESPLQPPSTSGGGTISEPTPLIRPTEFSSAQKRNFMDAILKKFKPSGVYVLGAGQGQALSKKKLVVTGSLLAVIVLVIVAKFTFAPYLPIPIPGTSSPEEKAAEKLISESEAGLESARVKIGENNLIEARKILRSYYEALDAENAKTHNEKINAIQGKILATLDELDKAVDLSPSLFQEVTQDFEDEFKTWSYVWSVAKGEIKIEKPDLASIGFYPYQDNLYILAVDGIYKITDGLKGKTSAVAWLSKDSPLPVNPVSLAIDSKVFVINEGGILTIYYKGEKTAEISTAIPVEKGSALLTTQDSTFLYLVDKSLGRIHVLTKEAGTLVKTLKLNNQEPILDASMADDGTIYVLTSDNKIWKVTP